MEEIRYSKITVRLEPGMERYMIVASVCRALAKANINTMIIAQFSNLATSKTAMSDLLAYCAQWVNLTGKEHYEPIPTTNEETTQASEPNLSAPT